MSDVQDPYVYPGTKLLSNFQDEHDPERAAVAERDFSLLPRRELELLEKQQAQNSATDPDYFALD